LGQDDAIDAWRLPCSRLANEAIVYLTPASGQDFERRRSAAGRPAGHGSVRASMGPCLR